MPTNTNGIHTTDCVVHAQIDVLTVHPHDRDTLTGRYEEDREIRTVEIHQRHHIVSALESTTNFLTMCTTC